MTKQPGSLTLIIGIGKSNKSKPMNPTESNVNAEKEAASEKPEFYIPEGFEVPEGIKDGDTFEATVTLKKQGNTLCVEAVDGIEVTAEDETKESPEDKAKEAVGESDMGFLDAVEAGVNKK